MRRIASRGFRIVGSFTRSTLTLVFPCQQSAFMKPSTIGLPLVRCLLVSGHASLLDRLFARPFSEQNSFRCAPHSARPRRLACRSRNLACFKKLFEVTQTLAHDLLRIPT